MIKIGLWFYYNVRWCWCFFKVLKQRFSFDVEIIRREQNPNNERTWVSNLIGHWNACGFGLVSFRELSGEPGILFDVTQFPLE